ncbi:MAG: methyltransferase domain-containing protein [Anaerolineae bacterium]|nr:methyltransferase domain-containing protein [Anaerolineae bacterium]
MTWLVAAGCVVVLLMAAALVYWHMIIAEGAYMGPRVVARTYDWVARRYDVIKQFSPGDEDWFVAAPLWRRLAGVERPLLLDVATGTGRVPLALARNRFLVAGGQIVGLDLSWGMLRQARTKLRDYGEQVGLIWQDASRLPFDDGAFDAVTCLEAMEFLPSPREALTEMVRVLAPGGLLMVTNRVGRAARLLPGRTFSRSLFQQALAALPLHNVETQAWQADYDLAVARKVGSGNLAGRGGVSLASLLRCPVCRDHVAQPSERLVLVCVGCGRFFPIRDGIVALAEGERRGGRR